MKDNKNEYTAWFVKNIENENKVLKLVIKVSLKELEEHKDFVNSIITCHLIKEKRFKKYLDNNKILLVNKEK